MMTRRRWTKCEKRVPKLNNSQHPQAIDISLSRNGDIPGFDAFRRECDYCTHREVLMRNRLLRSALDALAAGVAILVVLVHHAIRVSKHPGLRLAIHIL